MPHKVEPDRAKIARKPLRTFSEFKTCLLIALCAAKASIMAFINSAEMANYSMVLLAACCTRIWDSSNQTARYSDISSDRF
jgi:hypothetical protein